MINPESFVVKRITQTFWSKAYVIISEDDILRVLDLTTNELMKRIHDFLAQGPGLQVESVKEQNLNIVTFIPLNGSSYIGLPKELNHPMKGLINIRNNDNKCFMYCHLYHLYKGEIKNHPQGFKIWKKYLDAEGAPKSDIVNYIGIEFPVKINKINKIEKLNNIRINVYGYENKHFFPKYRSDTKLMMIIRERIIMFISKISID